MRFQEAGLWPSAQGSGWLEVAQQVTVFLTAAQRAPEVEHKTSISKCEMLALVGGWGLKAFHSPGDKAQGSPTSLFYHLQG